MSQQKTWTLSQDANKSSGICSSCRATHQLHLKDGTVHQHGPRINRCPGSNKLPLSAQQQLPASSASSQASLPASTSSSSTSSSAQSSSATPTSTDTSQTGTTFSRFAHPRLNGLTIKRIPKLAQLVVICCPKLWTKSQQTQTKFLPGRH